MAPLSYVRFLGCLLLTTCTLFAAAQVRKPDMLYKKDKSIIEAVIVEVGDSEIQYRRFSNPQGPVYSIKKAEVSKIVYTNGETEELLTTVKPEKKSMAKQVAPEKPQKEVVSKTKEKPAKEPKKEVAKVVKEPKKEVAKAPKEPKAPRASSESGGITFKVGVRGGVNLSTSSVKLDAGETIGYAPGYHGGLVFNIGSKNFSIQPEVHYSQFGFKFEKSDFKSQTTLSAVTVPILLKYSVGAGNLRFFVNAGGYGSYALNDQVKTTEKATGVTLTTNSDFKNVITDENEGRLEYGAVAGAGVAFMLGRAELFVDGRYYYTLGNNASAVAMVNKEFLRTIQVGFGVLIPLGN